MPVPVNVQLALTAILSVRDGGNAGTHVCSVPTSMLEYAEGASCCCGGFTFQSSDTQELMAEARWVRGTQENSGAEGLVLFKVRVEKVSQER